MMPTLLRFSEGLDLIKDFTAVGGLNVYTCPLLVPAGAKGPGFYGHGPASGRVGAAHFQRLAPLGLSDVAALVEVCSGFHCNNGGGLRAPAGTSLKVRQHTVGRGRELRPAPPERCDLGRRHPARMSGCSR